MKSNICFSTSDVTLLANVQQNIESQSNQRLEYSFHSSAIATAIPESMPIIATLAYSGIN